MTIKKFILGFWITICTTVQIGHKRLKEVTFTKPSKKFYELLLVNSSSFFLCILPVYYAIELTVSYLELGLHFDKIDNVSPNIFVWMTIANFIIVYGLIRFATFWWNLMPLDELLKEAGNYETLTFLQAKWGKS